MEKQTLESEIRDHYENQFLGDDVVDALVGSHANAAAARRRQKTLRWAGLFAVAALVVVAFGFFGRGATESPIVSEQAVVAEDVSVLAPDDPDTTLETPLQRPTEKTTEIKPYRLVAFRSHGDGCPFCRATGHVYDELAAELDDQEIDVEQFDLSNAAERGAVRRRIDQLQLTSLVEGRMETAFLTLIDREGRPVREFKPSMSSAVIARSIRELIAQSR